MSLKDININLFLLKKTMRDNKEYLPKPKKDKKVIAKQFVRHKPPVKPPINKQIQNPSPQIDFEKFDNIQLPNVVNFNVNIEYGVFPIEF